MIWDSHSSRLAGPNVDEREKVMAFHIGTTIVFDLLEGTCRHIIGVGYGF
jgi:hypothetical protein